MDPCLLAGLRHSVCLPCFADTASFLSFCSFCLSSFPAAALSTGIELESSVGCVCKFTDTALPYCSTTVRPFGQVRTCCLGVQHNARSWVAQRMLAMVEACCYHSSLAHAIFSSRQVQTGNERHTHKCCKWNCRYKDDQQREVQEAAEKAKLASMTDEERRRWELENPKVFTRHQALQLLLLQHCYVQIRQELCPGTQATAALVNDQLDCFTHCVLPMPPQGNHSLTHRVPQPCQLSVL